MSIILSYAVKIILIIGFAALAFFSFGIYNFITYIANDEYDLSAYESDKDVQKFRNLTKAERKTLCSKMIRFLKIYTAILLLATLISYVTNIL
jgi:hypothetical protein